MHILGDYRPMDRTNLALDFQPRLPGRLGEVTHAALYWDRGGTHTLARLRRVPDLHLLVVGLEGRADYVDEQGVSCVIGPGDVMMIPRGLAHSYRRSPGHGWSEIHAWLRGPLPDVWWRNGFLGPGLSLLRAEPLAEAAQHLCRFFAKTGAHAASNDERLAAFQVWLVRLKEASAPGAGVPRIPWFDSACRALDEGTLREPRLEELAVRLGVSYETFRKVFTTLAGAPPGQYRVAAVIQQACRCLREGGWTNKEVAARLEFSDEFHFARTFRQRIGLTPRQYRAMVRHGTP